MSSNIRSSRGKLSASFSPCQPEAREFTYFTPIICKKSVATIRLLASSSITRTYASSGYSIILILRYEWRRQHRAPPQQCAYFAQELIRRCKPFHQQPIHPLTEDLVLADRQILRR